MTITYPFGLEHKEEQCEHNEDYRYTYQGEYAEKDKETGFQAFQLRMYDPVIGRWMSMDPAGQYASGYVGMGNEPVRGIDPDGGWKTEKFANTMHDVFQFFGAQVGDVYLSDDGIEYGFNLVNGEGFTFMYRNKRNYPSLIRGYEHAKKLEWMRDNPESIMPYEKNGVEKFRENGNYSA